MTTTDLITIDTRTAAFPLVWDPFAGATPVSRMRGDLSPFVSLATVGRYLADLVIEARDWLRDLVWANMEDSDFDALTDDQVMRAIARYYDGGIAAFVAAGGAL